MYSSLLSFGFVYFCYFVACTDTTGNRTSTESLLSETPIVWRNTSVRFARDIRILVRGVNQFDSA